MSISLRLSPVTVTETFSGAVSEIIVSSDNDPVESGFVKLLKHNVQTRSGMQTTYESLNHPLVFLTSS